MKKIILITLISLLSYTSYSQINFEKGYYIDNNGITVKCLIKNTDWLNNPTKFKYKLSENSKRKSKSIKDVKEFGILNALKYKRYTVDIDRSLSINVDEMSIVKKPIFKKEQLFLKVLVEGDASLFFYGEGKLKRFFFKTNTKTIKQLIYKEYRATKTGINESYKQQIWNNLKCQTITLKNIKKLRLL